MNAPGGINPICVTGERLGHHRSLRTEHVFKGETRELGRANTLRSQTVSTKLQQIAKQASSNPSMVFSTLAHHMDVNFLCKAYHRTRKGKAPGVDRVTAKEYAENLEEREVQGSAFVSVAVQNSVIYFHFEIKIPLE